MASAPVIFYRADLVFNEPSDHIRVEHILAESNRKPSIIWQHGLENKLLLIFIIAGIELKNIPSILVTW